MKKQVLLKGKGGHQHAIYGNVKTDEKIGDFAELQIKGKALLKHEKPNGDFGEHKTLEVESGSWVMGLQIEFNPFKRTISQIWD